MQGLVFYILLPFIYLLSLLPFWVMYRVSDLMYFFLFYIIRYRSKVVAINLRTVGFWEATLKTALP